MSSNKLTDNKRHLANYKIRNYYSKDFKEILEIYAEVGFLIYKYGIEVVNQIDDHGVFVAEDIDTGQVLGFITGLNLSADLGFIGQYAVRHPYRGLGIGNALWNNALRHIGSDRNLALHSAPDMTLKYKNNSGFVVDSGIKICLFEGTVDYNLMLERVEGISVIPINEENIGKVIQYDRQICGGINRTILIGCQVRSSDIAVMVALNDRQEVVGYGVVCVTIANTVRTDQIYANTSAIGELLLAQCCRSLADRGITNLVYRCLDSNKQAIEVANRLNLVLDEGHSYSLLFTKCVVPFDHDKVFSPSCSAFHPF